jgi:Ca2+/Na+ antiporter
VLVTVLAAAVLLELLTPVAAIVLLLVVLVPYLLLVVGGMQPHARLPVAGRVRRGLADVLAMRAAQRSARPAQSVDHRRLLLLIGADVAVIVLGSLGMVSSAVALGGHWGLSGALIGVLVLGPLTSIPNAQTAIRLGLLSRGAALVSETFASNTINLLGGVMVPALFVQVASHSRSERFGLLWLAAMTAICILGLARREGIDRRWGGTLVALYGGFVAFQLLS